MFKTKTMIFTDKVKKVCEDYCYYTEGTNEEYENMFNMVRDNHINPSLNAIEMIAKDIKEHSFTEDDIAGIMFALINDCCVTYVLEDVER